MKKILLAAAVLFIMCLMAIVATLAFSSRNHSGGGAGGIDAFQEKFMIDSIQYVVKLRRMPDESFRVQIRQSSNNKVLFESSRNVSDSMRWFLVEKNGNIWFYSGDVGTFVFLRSSDSVWSEFVWSPGNPQFQTTKVPSEFFSKLPERDKSSMKPYVETP